MYQLQRIQTSIHRVAAYTQLGNNIKDGFNSVTQQQPNEDKPMDFFTTTIGGDIR